MKTLLRTFQLFSAALLFCAGTSTNLRAQGTAFTYQGKLSFAGTPMSGSFDFQFILFQYVQYGFPASPIVTNLAVPVTNGLFTATIDFGPGVFVGSNYWLDISVRTNNGGQFIQLAPRQPVTPSPYAVFATTASNLSGSLPVSQLSGTIPLSQLPAGIITNNQSGTVNLTGNFYGNGSGLNNIQLSSLGSPGTFSSSPLYFQSGVPYVIGPSPFNVAVTDVNNDGKPDLISTSGGGLVVLTNNGSGVFTSNATLSVGLGPVYIAVVTNVDGHGHQAVVSANANGNSLSILTNNGTGVFTLSQTISNVNGPQCVVVVSNYDGLGHQALVSANAGSTNLTVYTNNASGIFGTNQVIPVVSPPFGIAVADVNGDGKPDLISANPTSSTLSVYLNNGSGVFSFNATLSTSGSYCVATADFNGDGKIDLVASDYTQPGFVQVFTNNGNGTFTLNGYYQVGTAPVFVATADFNGDGKPDFVSANFYAGTLTVMTNNGAGGFGFYQTLSIGAYPNACAVGDFNNDGRPDIVSANRSVNTVSVFLNLPSPVQGLGVNGTINSPMWQVTTVFNATGPVFNGQGGSYYSNGGTLLIFVSGSGYSTTNAVQIGMNILVDGKVVDTCSIYANSSNQHLSFVPTMVRVGAGAGLHQITFSPITGTSTDGNDNFRIVVQELPF